MARGRELGRFMASSAGITQFRFTGRPRPTLVVRSSQPGCPELPGLVVHLTLPTGSARRHVVWSRVAKGRSQLVSGLLDSASGQLGREAKKRGFGGVLGKILGHK